MFGEDLFGDVFGGKEAAQTPGKLQPRGLFVQPLPNVDSSSEREMALAGVGWEEGDDPALVWTSELPTAGLSVNFMVALPSFTDILRHWGITSLTADYIATVFAVLGNALLSPVLIP